MRHDARVYQFCHKEVPYGLTKDSLHTPLEVGYITRDNHVSGAISDANGDNISNLNPCFAEQTGTYWIWRNHDTDLNYIITEQYRRRFNLQEDYDFDALIGCHSVIACKPLWLGRNSVMSQFCGYHSPVLWEVFRDAVDDMLPQYSEAFREYLENPMPKGNPAVLYYSGGFGAATPIFEYFCEELFSVLIYVFETLGSTCPNVYATVERLMKEGKWRQASTHGTGLEECVRYQSQICGFVAERFMTLWIRKNYEGRVLEIPYTLMENSGI